MVGCGSDDGDAGVSGAAGSAGGGQAGTGGSAAAGGSAGGVAGAGGAGSGAGGAAGAAGGSSGGGSAGSSGGSGSAGSGSSGSAGGAGGAGGSTAGGGGDSGAGGGTGDGGAGGAGQGGGTGGTDAGGAGGAGASGSGAGGSGAGAGGAGGAGGGVALPRLTMKGSQLLDPNGKKITLRGFNWGAWGAAQAGDAADNAAQGANVVRIPLSWYFDSDGTGVGTNKQDAYAPGKPGNINPDILALIDQQIDWAVSQKLWVDVMVRGADDDFWTNPAVIPQFLEMWSFLADHYKDRPYIGMLELLSEPHPTNDQHNNDKVKALYEQVIAAVRAKDAFTPVMIGPAKDYEIRDLEQVYLADQQNVIYTANFYELPAYVKQTKKGGTVYHYPGSVPDQVNATDGCDTENVGKTVTMNKGFLSGLLKCLTGFRDAHAVPVFIQQVGLRSEVPDSLSYATDVLALFNKEQVGFTYWTYRFPYRNNTDGSGEIGVLWQDSSGTWTTKTDWLTMISAAFKQ
jgi:hypothetical protein